MSSSGEEYDSVAVRNTSKYLPGCSRKTTMAQEVATARHLVHGGYSLDSRYVDYCIPVRLSAVVSQERPAQVIGMRKVNLKFD